MPNDSINLYIDSTFSTTSDGGEDVSAELTLADADVIGSYNMPVVYTTSASTPAMQLLNVAYTTSSSISGTAEQDVEYYVNTLASGVYTSLVDYSIGITISGSLDKIIDCFLAGDTGISGVPGVTLGAQNAVIDYIVGENFEGLSDINISTSFWRWPSISGSDNIPTQYTYLMGINTGIERTVYITMASMATMNSGTQSGYVDVEFAGWVNYPLTSDLFCTLQSLNKSVLTDTTTISGVVQDFILDVFSGVVASGTLNSDLYCCLSDFAGINTDLNTVLGIVNDFNCDLYSSVYASGTLTCDIDLLSLKISNFQPEMDEYVLGNGYISVDITDDIYNVLTSSGTTCSGSCLKVDGVAVPITFSSITDGYRMFYDPVDDFSSITGTTEFLVHAENSNGDVLERSYYLVAGYLVDYDNLERLGFDYGYETQVLVRMSAEDLATCPTFSAESYWFETEGLKGRDLGAGITGILPDIVSAETDLSASIRPKSLAYFYGKTFRVVLTCRDFSGNEMEPYEFEFRIEEVPE